MLVDINDRDDKKIFYEFEMKVAHKKFMNSQIINEAGLFG